MRDDETSTINPHPLLSRRHALRLGGLGGLVALLAACSSSSAVRTEGAVRTAPAGGATTSGAAGGATPSSAAAGGATSSSAAGASASATTAAASTAACVLAPEQTEGPYYLDTNLVRADLREDREGARLNLALTVVDASTCEPIAGANVDLWHADAGGTYSGVGGSPASSRYLRGIQPTDPSGIAHFTTIFPGWYPGRTVHIHVKVHLGGTTVHTGQLYFDDALATDVFTKAPYSSHRGQRTLNARDGIFRNGGPASIVDVVASDGGYSGTKVLGVAR